MIKKSNQLLEILDMDQSMESKEEEMREHKRQYFRRRYYQNIEKEREMAKMRYYQRRQKILQEREEAGAPAVHAGRPPKYTEEQIAILLDPTFTPRPRGRPRKVPHSSTVSSESDLSA